MEQELEQLVLIAIIEPVEFSEWATPIVAVVKQDGSVRICGDYRLTVNLAAKLDTYPLPCINDLLPHSKDGSTSLN